VATMPYSSNLSRTRGVLWVGPSSKVRAIKYFGSSAGLILLKVTILCSFVYFVEGENTASVVLVPLIIPFARTKLILSRAHPDALPRSVKSDSGGSVTFAPTTLQVFRIIVAACSRLNSPSGLKRPGVSAVGATVPPVMLRR
jgi:hypothetical protein